MKYQIRFKEIVEDTGEYYKYTHGDFDTKVEAVEAAEHYITTCILDGLNKEGDITYVLERVNAE